MHIYIYINGKNKKIIIIMEILKKFLLKLILIKNIINIKYNTLKTYLIFIFKVF